MIGTRSLCCGETRNVFRVLFESTTALATAQCRYIAPTRQSGYGMNVVVNMPLHHEHAVTPHNMAVKHINMPAKHEPAKHVAPHSADI